ncbi:MAG TPA: hypothetical protein VN030_15280 [Cellvibrio sp.]|nr:hypothetical protein [Cellvibrio sp.]
MKKKNLAIAGGIVIGFGSLILLSREQLAQNFPVLGNLLHPLTARIEDSDLSEIQAKTLHAARDSIAVAETLAAEPIAAPPAPAPVKEQAQPWKLGLSGSDPAPSLNLDSNIKSFSPISLDPHPAQLPSAGEQLLLPMLNNKSVKVNVESVTTNSNGDFIWSGHLDGHNNDYPVVMTYGENTTFATITTPEGSYSLEAVKGVGWLYKNPAEAELTHQGKDDFLIPDIK